MLTTEPGHRVLDVTCLRGLLMDGNDMGTGSDVRGQCESTYGGRACRQC